VVKPKLIHVTTVPETLGFFRGQIAYMKKRGFCVQAVSSPGEFLEQAGAREDIPVHPVKFSRRITPLPDLQALIKLYRLFRAVRPTIVHAHTPKGGLLGVVAARLAQVPVVLYGMRGLPFVTAVGLKKRLLCLTEVIACRAAHRVIVNSLANRATAVGRGLCPAAKIRVLAKGSSNGVDAAHRFNPHKLPRESRAQVRSRYRIPPDSLVIGYVGRIVRDKGIVELSEAWWLLRQQFPTLHLMLVGPEEYQDPVPARVIERLKTDSRVRFTGRVTDTTPFYAAMDILTLPTYREGFPNTPLEAAAMELPVVSTLVDGCSEAVCDGVTGFLVPPGNSRALAEAISPLLSNPELRRQMGKAGRRRAIRDFKPELIWKSLYENYLELLSLRSATT
jgi:glycosyltransferase involved in cell wall biosynthesis